MYVSIYKVCTSENKLCSAVVIFQLSSFHIHYEIQVLLAL